MYASQEIMCRVYVCTYICMLYLVYIWISTLYQWVWLCYYIYILIRIQVLYFLHFYCSIYVSVTHFFITSSIITWRTSLSYSSHYFSGVWLFPLCTLLLWPMWLLCGWIRIIKMGVSIKEPTYWLTITCKSVANFFIQQTANIIYN